MTTLFWIAFALVSGVVLFLAVKKVGIWFMGVVAAWVFGSL